MRFLNPSYFAAWWALSLVPVALGQTVLPYPDKANALFTIVAPDRWTTTPPGTADDYFTLEGPTGAVLYFRAVSGKLEEAMQETQQSLKESYTNIKLGPQELTTIDGLPAVLVKGTGTGQEDHTRTTFGMAWLKLPGGKIAEVWYEVPADDTSGSLRAANVMNSLKVAKVAPPGLVPELAAPRKEPGTIDDTQDFPFARPLTGAMLQQTTRGAEPFNAIFPGLPATGAVTTKQYALPTALPLADISTAYRKALESAGWSVVAGALRGTAIVLAHFERDGCDLWLSIQVISVQERISLLDLGTP